MQLPIETRCQVYDEIVQLFLEIEGQGIIIEDFYDGCILYDFDAGKSTCMRPGSYPPWGLCPGQRKAVRLRKIHGA